MFIRTERSIKEFRELYPIVVTLVIIHLVLLIANYLFPININFGGNPYFISQGEYWRLITPIFLHANISHALFNSFALILFGPALEQMLGKGKFIFAYLGAGIIGNIGTQIIESGNVFYNHVGASGAIYGLFGIYVYMVVFRKDLIDQANAQIVITIFIIGLIMTFVMSNINRSAHIFGFIGGLALAPIVLARVRSYSPWYSRRRYTNEDKEISFDPSRWQKRKVTEGIKRNFLWIILGALVIIGILSRL